MDVSIRLYQESYLERVITIWLEGLASTKTPFTINAEMLRSGNRSIPEMMRKHNLSIYVACLGDEVVAFIIFWGQKLDQLFVDPRLQRKGIGKKLIQLARRLRPQGFWLITAAANQNANRFYQGEGLRRTGAEIDPALGTELVRYEWKLTPPN